MMAAGSRQKGQNERRHDHLLSCVYIVEVLGDECQHWNEVVEQENRDEGYQRFYRFLLSLVIIFFIFWQNVSLKKVETY